RPMLQLKWPNDLWIDQRKFAGILIEVAHASPESTWLVAGIGVNLRGPALADRTSLAQHTQAPQKEALAQQIARHWQHAAAQFERTGFAPFLPRWQQRDALAGQWVQHLAQQARAFIRSRRCAAASARH
ncbi:hypothetical protein HC761_02545, partial [bacterium]|nr:hypothetical protein [bacterium]